MGRTHPAPSFHSGRGLREAKKRERWRSRARKRGPVIWSALSGPWTRLLRSAAMPRAVGPAALARRFRCLFHYLLDGITRRSVATGWLQRIRAVGLESI